MNPLRMLFVLTAVALASPALAGEHGKADTGKADTGKATTHSCPAMTDAQGKVRCACASGHEVVIPQPIFTDAG